MPIFNAADIIQDLDFDLINRQGIKNLILPNKKEIVYRESRYKDKSTDNILLLKNFGNRGIINKYDNL